MNEPIELRKTRDFGQIISDSFIFIKENFKQLFTALLVVCGIFIVIGTITSVMQYEGMMGLYSGIFSSRPNTYDFANYNESYILSALFNGLILMLLEVFIHLVTFCYISVYLQKGNQKPKLEEVWGYFRYYFFRVLGAGIVVLIVTLAGTIFCVIPGIYLGVALSLVIPIIIMENTSFGYAFNKSFRLIKDNWWLTLGVIFVTSLIVGVLDSVASIPVTIISVAGKFFAQKSYTMPLLIIFSALKTILLLAYVLPAVAIALCYFKYSEEKEGLGLLNRIENFGSENNDHSGHPAEEY